MSSTLIDFVEARLDAMNGVQSGMEVRIPAPPPITPRNSARTSARKRHVIKPSHHHNSKILTDSLHESFGWLEEYVDIKYEEMMKRNSASLGSQSFESALSSRDSRSFELKDSTDDKGHRRMHSRRESILIGLDQDDLQAIF